ncbi:Flp pilus assembly protein CpaB [uncultured Clostridium sp.]|nr:Flp pilus assembly protein CpaB [uncultured Clostridium sp.]SCJ45420.1 Flp pilus assembly protein CpaB [uncultured Clostridium sp.]
MGFKRNRTTTGVIAIVIASTLCFVIAPIYNKSIQKPVNIVQVTSDIKRGEKLTSDNVKVVETIQKYAPSSAVSEKDAIGKYAVADMLKEDIVLQKKLSKNRLSEDKYLYGLNGHQQAISFTIKNFASGLSGKLETGDIISVIATTEDDNGNEKTYTPKELTYVKVLAVTNSEGKDKGEKRIEDQKELPVTITVLANKQQAELIAKLESTSKMHVSLAFRGTEKEGLDYLNKQNSMLNH